MRIAFFGGSFDPPHRGHLAVARAAADRLHLDRVLLAPAGMQPLKPEGSSASFADRLAMVERAVAGDPVLAASDDDAPRANGEPNYTVDTIARLRSRLGPETNLFLLLGADSFLTLSRWHRPADLLLDPRLLDGGVIVAARPGFAVDDLTSALPAGVTPERPGTASAPEGVVTLPIADQHGRRSRLYLLPDLSEDISATHIRAELNDGGGGSGLLPSAVVEYVRAHGLYAC